MVSYDLEDEFTDEDKDLLFIRSYEKQFGSLSWSVVLKSYEAAQKRIISSEKAMKVLWTSLRRSIALINASEPYWLVWEGDCVHTVSTRDMEAEMKKFTFTIHNLKDLQQIVTVSLANYVGTTGIRRLLSYAPNELKVPLVSDKIGSYDMGEAKFGDMTLYEFKEKWVKNGCLTDDIPIMIHDLKKCIFYIDVHDINEWFMCDRGMGIGGVLTEVIKFKNGPIGKNEYIKILDYGAPKHRAPGRPKANEDCIELWTLIWDNRFKYRGWGVEYNIGKSTSECVNLFRGWAAKRIEYDPKSIRIETINGHILEIMCDGNKAIYDWFIKVLAWLFQKSEKTGVMPLLIGPEGVGKTIILEWIANKLMGMMNAFCCSTLEDITGRFGGQLESKRACFVNEVKGASRHDHDKLKTLITDYFLMMEKKGVDAKQIRSILCLFGISNHYDQHIIKQGQRRIVPIKCADKPKSPEYYAKLASVLEESADEYFSYLMDIDLTGFNPTAKPPNPFEQELIEDNKEYHIMFLQQYDWPFVGDKYLPLLNTKVYEDYQVWCKGLNYKYSIDIRWFVRKCGGLLDSKKSNSKTYWIRTDAPRTHQQEVEYRIGVVKSTSIPATRWTEMEANTSISLEEYDHTRNMIIYTCKDKELLHEIAERLFSGRWEQLQ